VSVDPGENRGLADLAYFFRREAEKAEESQGDEGGGLANISTCAGNPMSKGVNPEAVLSRAAQTLELISTVGCRCAGFARRSSKSYFCRGGVARVAR
jgi:hypothetical protein